MSDALLDTPMNEIVDTLPLADELKDALVYRQGPSATCSTRRRARARPGRRRRRAARLRALRRRQVGQRAAERAVLRAFGGCRLTASRIARDLLAGILKKSGRSCRSRGHGDCWRPNLSCSRPVDGPGPRSRRSARDVVLLARQPILNTAEEILGHELLFRRDDGSGWPIDDEDQATARVLVAAFADMAFGALTSGARAWINTRRSFLLETDLSVLPPDRVVLEVLERDAFDATLVARVAELAAARLHVRARRLRLARRRRADHARGRRPTSSSTSASSASPASPSSSRLLEPYDVQIVGEKVETAEEVSALVRARASACSRATTSRSRAWCAAVRPSADIGRLRKATSLTSSASFEDVEQVVKLDPGISMRLLRYINSAAVSMRSTVSSLRQALMLVGANTVRQWLLLVLLGDLGSMKPAVLSAGLLRARLCETLAPEHARAQPRQRVHRRPAVGVRRAARDAARRDHPGAAAARTTSRTRSSSATGRSAQLLTAAIELERGDVAPKNRRPGRRAVRVGAVGERPARRVLRHPKRPDAAQAMRSPSSAPSRGSSRMTVSPRIAPSTSTSERTGPICRGGKFTTATTCRPTSSSRV